MLNALYLVSAIESAVKAGSAIVAVYESDFTVETKDDASPLTLADKKAHEIIKAGLIDHNIPFISEEGKHTPYAVRKDWSMVWIVDPLDGTKEFVKRNGEFTVNIALVENQRPILGVIYAPVPQWLYFASTEIGAYKLAHVVPEAFRVEGKRAEERLGALIKKATKLPFAQARETYTIMGSRSHGTPELEAFVEAKKQAKGNVMFTAAGSSLKICLVAEGSADIYPRLGPTMEWDTAAGQAIAQCSGASLHAFDSDQALTYNKENLLNPWFVVERLEGITVINS